MKLEHLKKLIKLTIVLAFCVILLGAYTRLTNAGLGCPDWPGCYGKILVPNTVSDMDNDNFGATWEFNSTKAWTEMVHRYLAGSLGSLIIIISLGYITNIYRNKKSNLLSNTNNRQNHQTYQINQRWVNHYSNDIIQSRSILIPILLICTLVFQALLGMWTVTLKLLPTVVMGHLIGGFTTLCLLVILLLKTFKFNTSINFSKQTKTLVCLTFIMLFIQIILGGWTSSNYAALPCLDFPSCNGQYLPSSNTLSAMNPFVSIGPNYEGGLLSYQMRVTIQLFHRWGALITSILLILTSFNLIKYNSNYYTKFAIILISLLCCQVTLGIINIKWALPLAIAVLHNAIACLLLISLLVLNYKVNYKSDNN